jgi:DNA-binding NarL/FixJ family response regulator
VPDTRIEILIADDHPVVRQGLRQIIETDAGMEIVGEAGNGADALASARELNPAVILLDVDLPDMDGFSVCKTLLEQGSKSKIIFLTVHREERFMRKALDLGASGYVLKDSAITDILTAIRTVMSGHPYISPAMTEYLLRPRSRSGKKDIDALTPAEIRVLRLIGQYKTTKEIAEILFISPRTVESHRSTITQKLGLRGSHSLMRYALQHLDEMEED